MGGRPSLLPLRRRRAHPRDAPDARHLLPGQGRGRPFARPRHREAPRRHPGPGLDQRAVLRQDGHSDRGPHCPGAPPQRRRRGGRARAALRVPQQQLLDRSQEPHRPCHHRLRGRPWSGRTGRPHAKGAGARVPAPPSFRASYPPSRPSRASACGGCDADGPRPHPGGRRGPSGSPRSCPRTTSRRRGSRRCPPTRGCGCRCGP